MLVRGPMGGHASVDEPARPSLSPLTLQAPHSLLPPLSSHLGGALTAETVSMMEGYEELPLAFDGDVPLLPVMRLLVGEEEVGWQLRIRRRGVRAWRAGASQLSARGDKQAALRRPHSYSPLPFQQSAHLESALVQDFVATGFCVVDTRRATMPAHAHTGAKPVAYLRFGSTRPGSSRST